MCASLLYFCHAVVKGGVPWAFPIRQKDANVAVLIRQSSLLGGLLDTHLRTRTVPSIPSTIFKKRGREPWADGADTIHRVGERQLKRASHLLSLLAE